jgi:tetratricopeptide (TPR) repeat protein
MRHSGFVLAWALALAGCGANAAHAIGADTCRTGVEHQQVLDACAAWIASSGTSREETAEAHRRRGVTYRVFFDDADKAIIELDAALRLVPEDTEALSERAKSFFDKGEHAKAAADLSTLIRIKPDNADHYVYRGLMLTNLGRFDEAIADLDRAIQLEPRANAYFVRSLAYADRDEHDRARADFAEALRRSPDTEKSYLYLGRGERLEKKGALEQALADYRAALGLDPTSAVIKHAVTTLERQLASRPAASDSGPPKPDATALATTPLPVAPAPALPQATPRVLPPAAPRTRVALVIGNGAYQHATRLPNPTNDAADVAQALRRLGFEVVDGRDLDRRGMEDKVREFSRKLDRAHVALFFYAGHGMQVAGRNYLIPVDAKLERAGDINFETVDISHVLGQMEADQRVNLVFLDACRDNPLARSFARSLGTRSTAVGQGLASIQGAVGTMIAYATQPDAVALDGDGRNSPFTAALLKHLATPGLDIGVLMRRVRADVVQETRGRQVPWDHSSLIGEIVLAQ